MNKYEVTIDTSGKLATETVEADGYKADFDTIYFVEGHGIVGVFPKSTTRKVRQVVAPPPVKETPPEPPPPSFQVHVKSAWQRKPDTCVEVMFKTPTGAKYTGVGFTKCKNGDKWDADLGFQIAALKALMDAEHQHLEDLTGIRNVKF